MNLCTEQRNWSSITRAVVVLGQWRYRHRPLQHTTEFLLHFHPLSVSWSQPVSSTIYHHLVLLTKIPLSVYAAVRFGWALSVSQPYAATCKVLLAGQVHHNLKLRWIISLRVWHWCPLQYICHLRSIPARNPLYSHHLYMVSGLTLVTVLARDRNKGRERVESLRCGSYGFTCRQKTSVKCVKALKFTLN